MSYKYALVRVLSDFDRTFCSIISDYYDCLDGTLPEKQQSKNDYDRLFFGLCRRIDIDSLISSCVGVWKGVYDSRLDVTFEVPVRTSWRLLH